MSGKEGYLLTDSRRHGLQDTTTRIITAHGLRGYTQKEQHLTNCHLPGLSVHPLFPALSYAGFDSFTPCCHAREGLAENPSAEDIAKASRKYWGAPLRHKL